MVDARSDDDRLAGWGWFETTEAEATENNDLTGSFARCFNGGDGLAVVGHLRQTILDRRLGPRASDAELRFLEGHARIWRTPFIDEMRDWRPGRNGRDDGLDAVSACILAEPVRFGRTHMTGQNWRLQSISRALEVDFYTVAPVKAP